MIDLEVMQNERVARTFREMCGDFFPAQTDETKRFVLSVPNGSSSNIKVPVFIRRDIKAQYPEIRISPFVSTPEILHVQKWTRSPGVAPMEVPDVMYRRTRVDARVVRSTFQVDIFALDEVDIYRIREALRRRIHQFKYVESAPFVETQGWEEILDIHGNSTGAYLNNDYNPDMLDLIKAYENGEKLVKTEDVENTIGSWNLTDEGLHVHPYEDINKIEYWEITNGGKVLSDGYSIQSKGIMNIRTIQSRAFEELDPLIIRWILMFRVDYLSTTKMDVGRTFGEVNANVKENK